ncbi:MAG TPA: PspC domain-containing protein [Mycobacteriales bacterium]|nr:PspC domain-containing protein [Mycobacteriales bacterium]
MGRPGAEPGVVAHRRLTRRQSGRMVAGVATGLAAHLGVPVLWVRVALVALTIGGGAGALAYAAFWVLLPLDQTDQEAEPASKLQLAAFSAAAALGLLVLRGLGLDSPAVLPLLLAGVGVGLVWRQSDELQRSRWRASATTGRWRRWPAVAGALLLALGLAGFLGSRGELAAAREGLLSTVVVVGGLVLLGLPWVVRTVNDLRAERVGRIRSQERAELAAQVHDSVLQTLALIQKAADDPREVARLARSSERELRSWLYRPEPVTLTFGGALEQAAVEVEEVHGVPVEVVVVGDAPHDERLGALVSAAREAVVNAAKHSGAPLVQVYAEVEPVQVTVFVRDRGRGFDPEAVPADRYGLSESVAGRVARAGGLSRVRSAPGEGTEVRLQVPRG